MNGNSNGHGIGRSGQVHIKTPLLYSAPLSKHCSSFSSAGSSRPISVYLKLDNLQPSGSFKIRGLGYTIAKRARAEKGLHVITSSGGNAGLAAAHAANVLHLPCDVFVPSSCEAEVQALMRAEGATVTVVGNAWDDCDVAAKALSEELSSKGTPTCYVHPFEGEDLIEGHSSLGKEIYAQLREEAGIERGPDAVICSVGGGGLLRGLLRGMQTTRQERAQEKGLATPLMVTTQCHGANSFSQSLAASISEKGKPKLVTLDAITSQATSMGAKTCSRSAVEDALAYRTAAEGKLATVVMPDDLARAAAWRESLPSIAHTSSFR